VPDASRLRRLVLGTLDMRGACMCPHVFTIVREEAGGAARSIPAARRCEAAARAMRGAVVRATGLRDVSLDENYLEAGGSLRQAPRLRECLDEAGLSGLRLEDLRRPWSLRDLASALAGRGDGSARS